MRWWSYGSSFRYSYRASPLPAIVLALLLDTVDGDVIKAVSGGEQPPEYQPYDKALDIYYLAIAYLSTIRNWRYLAAFQISRFLFYWRLIGVAIFELSGARWLLVVFTNVFEYFFIWYEAVRTRWNPLRFSIAHVVAAAVTIWLVIKLPQEVWIHVAKLSLGDELDAHPELYLVVIAVVVGALILAWRYQRSLGPPDWEADL